MIDSPKKAVMYANLIANNKFKTNKLIKKNMFPLAVVSFEFEQLTGTNYDFLRKYTTKENATYIFRQVQSFPTRWVLTNKYAIGFDSLDNSRDDKFIREIADWYLQWHSIPINPMTPFKNLAERRIPDGLESSQYSKKNNGHIYVPINQFSDNDKMKLDVSLLEQTVSLYLTDSGINFHPKLYKNILEH